MDSPANNHFFIHSFMTRAHIFFSGTVQGVGFRYTTRHIAADLNLKGWVRNLPDGRVEMVVEGAKEIIEELCARLIKRFDGFIQNREIDYTEAAPHYKNFEVVQS